MRVGDVSINGIEQLRLAVCCCCAVLADLPPYYVEEVSRNQAGSRSETLILKIFPSTMIPPIHLSYTQEFSSTRQQTMAELSQEEKIQLAIQDIHSSVYTSISGAAKVYQVPRSTFDA